MQKAESLSHKSIKGAQVGLKHKLIANDIIPSELDQFSVNLFLTHLINIETKTTYGPKRLGKMQLGLYFWYMKQDS